MHRVLVVDDEPEYLEELVEALGFCGIPVVSVPHGGAALEVLGQQPGITAVLTDIKMPDMDGVTLIDAARAAFPGRALHFIVMTGHGADADLARALAAGATRWFPKPLPFEELRAALMELDCAGHDKP